MQGNDLGTHYSHRNAVMLEDAIYKMPEGFGPRLLAKTGRWSRVAELCELNEDMCTWISWHGREHSLGTEIWSLLPQPLFDRLIVPIMQVCGDYVLETHVFGSIHLAYRYLAGNPDISAVYDVDIDRLEKFWHVRGYRFTPGTTPQ